ncbi:MAG: fasciclin domain-containing protein [Flavipsychrobacter sp.]|nr:fasciclin domain-containing protein [Flavipsychrobacter sp.]
MKSTLKVMMIAAISFTSCNSSDTQNSTPAETENALASTTSSAEDNVSQHDVVQVAIGSKDHTTLVAAVKQAELVEPLRKTGPYTVFAPTNEAFSKLPAGTVDGLMKPDQKDALADILQYHVSVGIYKEDMFQDGQVIGQVNSQNITISKKDGKIKINGTANILAAIPASNGLIYVIDQVLLPPQK